MRKTIAFSFCLIVYTNIIWTSFWANNHIWFEEKKKKNCLELAKPLKLSGNTDRTFVYEHLQNLENWVQIQSHRQSSVLPKLLFGHPDDYDHLNWLRFNWLKSLQNHQKFTAGTNFHRHICHFQTLQRSIFFTCMHIIFIFFLSNFCLIILLITLISVST